MTKSYYRLSGGKVNGNSTYIHTYTHRRRKGLRGLKVCKGAQGSSIMRLEGELLLILYLLEHMQL